MKILYSKLLLIALQLLMLNFFFTVSLLSKNRDEVHAKIIRTAYHTEKDSSIQLGLLIQLTKDWHIYWKNPGDTGIPTSIEWSVPKDYQLIPKHWPIPKAFEFDGLVSYGYEDQVLFVAELKIPNNMHEREINLSVKIESLICKDVCIPFDTLISYQLDLRKSFIPDDDIADLFSKTINKLPVPIDSNFLKARINSDKVYLRMDKSLHGYLQDENIYFLSYENGLFTNSIKQQIKITDGLVELVIEADQYRTKEPEEVYGLLIFNYTINNLKHTKAYEIKIPITK